MLLKDIKVGGRYVAKVNGQIVTVRVLGTIELVGYTRWATHWRVLNESTGRECRFKSVQRFRSPAYD